MNPREYLDILHVAEKLKDTMRHCTTSKGRPESVAEHSWRISLMAMLLEKEFPEIDINKVIKMCLIHDLGECFTGDIPVFKKTSADSAREDELLAEWVATLPPEVSKEWQALYEEMDALETPEAKLYKALDKLEAVLSHDESDLDTWLPLEYDLQLTYGRDNVAFSPRLQALKDAIDAWTEEKIRLGEEGKPLTDPPKSRDEGDR